jgi:hypothetical protein
MIRIEVDISGAKARLAAIPGALEAIFRRAVRRGVAGINKVVVGAVRSGYNLAPAYIRDAIKPPQFSKDGLSATVRISGSRVPLYLFPARDIYPQGTEVFEQTSSSFVLKHFFRPNHPRRKVAGERFWERIGKGDPAATFRSMTGLSVPQMAAAPKSEEQIREAVETRVLDTVHQIANQVLLGRLVMRNGRLSRASDND